jgi:hypothetical protein
VVSGGRIVLGDVDGEEELTETQTAQATDRAGKRPQNGVNAKVLMQLTTTAG